MRWQSAPGGKNSLGCQMMDKLSRFALIVISVLGLNACAGFASPNTPMLHLQITDHAATGCLSYPVAAGDTFVVEYFHSYSKWPVREFYTVLEDNVIELKKIVQKASQCSSIIYPEVRLRKDGWLEISNIHRVTPEISFISGSPDLGNHTIEINRTVIRLSDTFEGGSEIQIRIVTSGPCSASVKQ